ncbi:MAG: serine/threonine-protein phosphatase [Spirochaetes bacterium]|nr:serine/threonine-protein phosphatase [Spirochaetota bacterium]
MANIAKRFFIAMSEEDREYRDTFEKELNYQSGRVLPLACISTLSWLTYIPIDRALFPDETIIVVLRILFPAMGIVLYTLYRMPSFRNYHLYLLVYFGAHMAISCAVLTGLTGGHPAYVGGFLFILTLLALGPVKKRYACLILYTAVSIFFTVGILKGMKFSDPIARYSLNDVLAVTAVTSVFIFILDKIRFTSWQKSKTIEMNRRIIEEQNRLFEHQLCLAGELQKKLLPHKLPDVENVSIAFSYQPQMMVGGDFVDVCYSSDRNGIGLFVCDVSGHGVAAAFIASMVKMVLSNWHEHVDQPQEMLQLLYHSLVEKLGSNFVTVSICFVDQKTGRARFAGAGHPPALLVRSGGTIEFIKPHGKIINGLMNPAFEIEERVLDENDKIVLYTDGIIECFNENGEMFGEEAFLNLIEENHQQSPESLCERILQHVNEFIGGSSFRDDITLLVMEFAKGRKFN